MTKIMRRRWIFLMVIFTSSAIPNILGTEGKVRHLVSPELLKQAKLKTIWENELPIKKGESVERLIIVGDYIYILSSQNYMICLDRGEGKMKFGNSIAPPRLPILGLEPYKDELISIVGNKLVEIEPETGKEISSFEPEFGIVCPAARNNLYFYLGGTDRRLHAFHANNKVKVFEAAAENESMISSIIADENKVIFSTDAGNLISITPDRPVKLWQFDAAGGIIGPVVKDGISLFFACKDTCVYRVDIVHEWMAELIWKHQTNALLDKAPYIAPGVVYQQAGGKGISAIDKQNGKLLWQLTEGADLLAQDKARAYVISKAGTLVVMDNIKGAKLYTVNFAQVNRYAVNTQDWRMYIADKSGRIACLEPIE